MCCRTKADKAFDLNSAKYEKSTLMSGGFQELERITELIKKKEYSYGIFTCAENLQVQFQTKKGINTAVDLCVSFCRKGRILGIVVGESGCEKATSMSILQLLGSNAWISWR